MKQITIILIIFFMTSCYTDVQKVENPKEITTIEIQELPKFNANISINAKYLYVFNKENEVIYKFEQRNNDSTIIVHSSVFLIMFFMSILFILVLNILIEKDSN